VVGTICIGNKNVAGVVLERGMILCGRKTSGGVIYRSSVFCFCFFLSFPLPWPLLSGLASWICLQVPCRTVDGHTFQESIIYLYYDDIGIIPWDIMRLECIIEGVGNDSEACYGSVGGCAPVMCSSGYGNFAKEGGWTK